MKKSSTANKKTNTNNIVVTYKNPVTGGTFCGRYKTFTSALKTAERYKKCFGFETIKIDDLNESVKLL